MRIGSNRAQDSENEDLLGMIAVPGKLHLQVRDWKDNRGLYQSNNLQFIAG
jgi:hypothetical protein